MFILVIAVFDLMVKFVAKLRWALTLRKHMSLGYKTAITAAGVVPCGGPKKSPRTSSIVQIIFSFRSFEISKAIQSVQNTHV